MFGIFDNLKTKITIFHEDGSEGEIIGRYDKGLVFIDYEENHRVKISENDRITVHNKNGVDETFIVTEPSFYNNALVIPAHYQCKVMRLSEFEREHSEAGHINIKDFQGNNNIINLGNNNHNVVNDSAVFDKMIACINQIEDINNKDEIITAINEMKAAANDKNSFFEKYTKFISLVGMHTAVIQPFLPTLSKFFSS